MMRLGSKIRDGS